MLSFDTFRAKIQRKHKKSWNLQKENKHITFYEYLGQTAFQKGEKSLEMELFKIINQTVNPILSLLIHVQVH